MIMPDGSDTTQTPELPTEPGWYLDWANRPWFRNREGHWSTDSPFPVGMKLEQLGPFRRLIVMTNDDDVSALDEARSWARHGYELGQRFAYWSDFGVAPAWLTRGGDA